MTLLTDQKVGGSSPSERATHTGLVGNPGEACCRMGPGASKRSSCVYPWSTRFGPFEAQISLCVRPGSHSLGNLEGGWTHSLWGVSDPACC